MDKLLNISKMKAKIKQKLLNSIDVEEITDNLLTNNDGNESDIEIKHNPLSDLESEKVDVPDLVEIKTEPESDLLTNRYGSDTVINSNSMRSKSVSEESCLDEHPAIVIKTDIDVVKHELVPEADCKFLNYQYALDSTVKTECESNYEDVKGYKHELSEHQTESNCQPASRESSDVPINDGEASACETKGNQVIEQHSIDKRTSQITMYECKVCVYKTKQKKRLVSHMLNHKDASEVVTHHCGICEYSSVQKPAFKKHMLLHKSSSEVQMYRCPICTYKTKFDSYLKSHMVSHEDPAQLKIYQCQKCNYKGKRKSDLSKHVLLIHRDFAKVFFYRCKMCLYKTDRECNLKQHLLVHKGLSEL